MSLFDDMPGLCAAVAQKAGPGEDTPLTAIREDRAREVMAAVRALLEDQPDV